MSTYESPLCEECGIRKVNRRGMSTNGKPSFRKKCNPCRGKKYPPGSRKSKYYRVSGHLKLALMMCQKCGFKAEHPCQLDIDHIDGNRHNDDPSNHQILCANCHRLKTLINKDYQNKTGLA